VNIFLSQLHHGENNLHFNNNNDNDDDDDDDDDDPFALNQHDKLDFCCSISQSSCRHVATLEHIILIPSSYSLMRCG
jgi:hypothetical protein